MQGQDSEFVIRDATKDKMQGKDSEFVIWDAIGDKPQGRIVDL